MGRLFVRLFKRSGAEVIICGREKWRAQRTARMLHVKARSMTDLATADVVIVCVPIENTVKVCTDALRYMKDASLLIDISSVKSRIVDRIHRVVPLGIEYLSIHPLFGPSIRKLDDQNIVAIPIKPGRFSDEMIAFLNAMGFYVHICSAEEHDQIMSIVQVMHHYAYLVIAVQLARLMKLRRTMPKLVTRSLARTMNIISTFGDIEHTILSIQELNPYGLQSRKSFAKLASTMASMNARTKLDIKQAIRTIKKFQALDRA